MIFISTLNYSIAKSLGWTELVYITEWDCYLGVPPNGEVDNIFGLKLKVPNFLLKPHEVGVARFNALRLGKVRV